MRMKRDTIVGASLHASMHRESTVSKAWSPLAFTPDLINPLFSTHYLRNLPTKHGLEIALSVCL